MADSLLSLNSNGAWVTLSEIDENRTVSFINDASPNLTLTSRNPLGVIQSVTNNGSGIVRLTLAAAATETIEGYVFIDQVVGFYTLNGLHAATVVSPTEIDLTGFAFAAGFRAGEGNRHVYKVVPGMDQIALTYVTGSDGQYFAEISGSLPYYKGGKYNAFIWDSGTYAGQYVRRVPIQGG